MIQNVILGALLAAPLLAASPLLTAPLPQVDGVAIVGTVVESSWVPARKLKATPGFSGSLGRDRVLPAHLVVTLSNFEGPKAKRARMLNAFVGASAENPPDGSAPPKRIVIWINSEKRITLAAGTRIRVRGYRVTGDEGGTWAVNEGWEILGDNRTGDGPKSGHLPLY